MNNLIKDFEINAYGEIAGEISKIVTNIKTNDQFKSYFQVSGAKLSPVQQQERVDTFLMSLTEYICNLDIVKLNLKLGNGYQDQLQECVNNFFLQYKDDGLPLGKNLDPSKFIKFITRDLKCVKDDTYRSDYALLSLFTLFKGYNISSLKTLEAKYYITVHDVPKSIDDNLSSMIKLFITCPSLIAIQCRDETDMYVHKSIYLSLTDAEVYPSDLIPISFDEMMGHLDTSYSVAIDNIHHVSTEMAKKCYNSNKMELYLQIVEYLIVAKGHKTYELRYNDMLTCDSSNDANTFSDIESPFFKNMLIGMTNAFTDFSKYFHAVFIFTKLNESKLSLGLTVRMLVNGDISDIVTVITTVIDEDTKEIERTESRPDFSSYTISLLEDIAFLASLASTGKYFHLISL